MDRRAIKAREGWQAIIEEQGLVYWPTELPDGSKISYWTEDAMYSLTEAEVYDIEAVARLMMTEMLIPAGDFIIEHNLFARMGIPGWMVPRIKETWESEPPMLYGRFDFAYGHDNVPRLLEYNADTPTCLLETAVQWHWLIDHFGEGGDQWNRVHEALVERWKELDAADRLPGAQVHFAWTGAEESGEDFMTVAYLAETAKEANLRSEILKIEDFRFGEDQGFVDPMGKQIRACFKLYPWEWMAHEQFAKPALDRMGDRPGQTLWIEPVWKMLWSNKGILPVLWHLFPNHPNLLPAYFEQDGELVDVFGERISAEDEAALGTSVVRKPLLAREGANTKVLVGGNVVEEGPDQDYGEEGFVVQQYTDLGDYGGSRPVLGVWTVDMEPAGLGIRESDNYVTNNQSRFVPHVIED